MTSRRRFRIVVAGIALLLLVRAIKGYRHQKDFEAFMSVAGAWEGREYHVGPGGWIEWDDE